jgi:hypothetical protein
MWLPSGENDGQRTIAMEVVTCCSAVMRGGLLPGVLGFSGLCLGLPFLTIVRYHYWLIASRSRFSVMSLKCRDRLPARAAPKPSVDRRRAVKELRYQEISGLNFRC